MERVVLADTVSLDDVDDARVEQGWHLANLVAARADMPAQQVLLTRDRLHILQLVEDARLGVRYFVVTGPDVTATRRTIAEALPTVDDVTLTQLLIAGDPRALALAVLMCNEPRPDVLQAFELAFTDRKDAARTFALVASAYARWPALRSKVARVAGTDPSAAIRERALLILDAWPS